MAGRSAVPAMGRLAVAQVLDIDPETSRKRIAKVLANGSQNGALDIIEKEDEQRRPRKFVVVGKWAHE
jgi:hypothetical protein